VPTDSTSASADAIGVVNVIEAVSRAAANAAVTPRNRLTMAPEPSGSTSQPRCALRHSSLESAYLLLHTWLRTPLTFEAWDSKPSGRLADFPSEQPAPSEQWVPLSRGDFTEPPDVSPGEHWPPSEGPQA